jgi:hypothetical protein
MDWFHPYVPSDHKYNLSIFRLMHFLSVVFLVRYYVEQDNPALRWCGGCVVESGRWSLQIFSMGAVLSEIGTVVFAIYSPSVSTKLAFNVGAILLTALTGIVLASYGNRAQPMETMSDGAKGAISAEIGL